MMKRIMGVAGIILMLCHYTLAQQGQERKAGLPSGTVYGKVVEEDNGKPIEYAYVVLYKEEDSNSVGKSITDKEGSFQLTDLRSGQYYVEIQFVGFGSQWISDIIINRQNAVVNLGTIKMELSAEMLDELEVEADRNRVEYRLDRRIVNVSQDLGAVGGTVVEALRNVPSIQTDIDDNVSIRGSENFLVLIDGRPSPVSGSDALQQIPAESVESIEIITNPSAKYDPDGVGGIINVIMKKDRRKGYNAQISANYGSFNSLGGDFLVNIRKKKINFFIGGNYNERINRGHGKEYRESYLPGDTTLTLETENDRQRIINSGSIRTGIDYFFNKDEVLTLTAQYRVNTFGHQFNSSTRRYKEYSGNHFDTYHYLTDNDLRTTWGYYQTDLNYQKKWSPDHELQAFGSFAKRFSERNSVYSEMETDEQFVALHSIADSVRTLDDQFGNRWLGQIDYERPVFDNSKLEMGYRIHIYDIDNEYSYQFFDGTIWQDDPMQYNPYTFYRNIQSGYLLFSNTVNRFGYMLGLRTEYTDREFHQTETEEKWAYNKFDFFPSVHLSYDLPFDMEVMASYSRRMQRPRHWYLSPFESVVDPNNVRRGNPLLEPEYTNSFELNIQKKINRQFIALEGYYRETNNSLERRIEVEPDRPDIFIATLGNIGESVNAGGELMTNLHLSKWWNVNLTGSVYYYEIIDINNTVSWFSRINNTFRIPATQIRMELSGFYNGASITTQGRITPFYMVNAAVRQDFPDRKLSVNLSVTDVFNTMGHEMFLETSNAYSHLIRQRRGPTFRLSLTYRFNDFEQRKEKSGSDMNGVDDVM